MRANQRIRQTLGHDHRGNGHIIEVMAVGVMIAIVITAAVVQNQPTTHERDLPASPMKVGSWLDTYMAWPSDNASFQYTHLLEEMMFHYYADEDNALQDKVYASFLGPQARVWFQHEGYPIPVYGPTYAPGIASQTQQRDYVAKYGTTLIEPGLSKYSPDMAIDLTLLPLWAHNIPESSGIPYTVTMTAHNDDGDRVQRSTGGWVRPAHNDGTTQQPTPREVPILVDFVDLTGTHLPTLDESSTDLKVVGPETHWDVRLKLHVDDATEARTWLDNDVVRVYPPPGWRSEDHDTQNWTHVEDDAFPILRYQYQGARPSGPGSVWLNLTLSKSSTDAVEHYQVLHASLEEATASNADLVLRPLVPLIRAPFGLQVSHTDPLFIEPRTPFRVLVVNPTTEDYDVESLVVTFPGLRISSMARACRTVGAMLAVARTRSFRGAATTTRSL